MHYTSGTTGRRKGVWSGVLHPSSAAALVDEERELWGFAADDPHLVLSALHHSAPLRFAAGTLLAGGAVAVLPSFDATGALRAIADVAPTTLFCAPAHLQRLFAAVDEGSALVALDRVRLLAHAGAPCPAPLKQRTVDAFPAGAVWEFYGSTEGQFTACPPSDWVAHPGSVGRARPGRRLSVDPDGTIWCGVPKHARFSYWRDPDLARGRLHRRRPRPARRQRVPLPRRAPGGPADHRRGQRLPPRGRARARARRLPCSNEVSTHAAEPQSQGPGERDPRCTGPVPGVARRWLTSKEVCDGRGVADQRRAWDTTAQA